MPCLDAGFHAVASGDQPPDQVMLVRVDDQGLGELARFELVPVVDAHDAVDLRRVGLRARDRAVRVHLVDDDPFVLLFFLLCQQ